MYNNYMSGVKKLVCCAFLFFLCFLLLRCLSSSQPVEALRGRGGIWHRGVGCGWRGCGGGLGRGYHGLGHGYYGRRPVYIYDDSAYYYPPHYWHRYIPFMNYFYS